MSDLVVRFTDARGVAWSVWEDFESSGSPAESDSEPAGALVFGSLEGLRRLPLAPPNWWDLPPAELAQLCACAVPVERRRPPDE